MNCGYCFCSFFQEFLWLFYFLPHMRWHVQSCSLCRLVVYLPAAFSSSVLCFSSCSSLALPRVDLCFPLGEFRCVLHPVQQHSISISIKKCVCRAHLICFPSVRVHYPSLPDVQCLENCKKYIFPYF